MGSSDLEAGLRTNERTQFVASCRWQGYRPEQFRVAAEPLDVQAPFEQMICVTYLPFGGQRRYRTDFSSRWLKQFENDLHAGLFDAWPVHVWE